MEQLNATRRPLTDVEVAAEGRIDRRVVRYALETGALPAVRIGRSRLVDPDDAARWLATHRADAASKSPTLAVPAEPRSWLDHARRNAMRAQTR